MDNTAPDMLAHLPSSVNVYAYFNIISGMKYQPHINKKKSPLDINTPLDMIMGINSARKDPSGGCSNWKKRFW
jgi:hypothetical protein